MKKTVKCEYKLVGFKKGEISWFTNYKSNKKELLRELKLVLSSEVDEVILTVKKEEKK